MNKKIVLLQCSRHLMSFAVGGERKGVFKTAALVNQLLGSSFLRSRQVLTERISMKKSAQRRLNAIWKSKLEYDFMSELPVKRFP